MTNREAIEQLKGMKLDFKAETIINGQDMNSATLIKYSMNIDAIELAIAALEKQEREKWHPVNPDDRKSYPDTGRRVLVTFSNSADLAVANFYEDDEGGAFYPSGSAYSYNAMGKCTVIAWRELPEGYEEGTD